MGRDAATSESLGGTTYSSSFAYNPDDLPTTRSLPGSVQETMQYDGAGRLTHAPAA